MSTRYIALLRGINVGRNKRVAMVDLRDLLTGLGCTDVRTHLQSGNAIFTSPSGEAAALAAEIESALFRDVGVQSTVIMRIAAELAAVVESNPLRDIASDPARHLVGFLAARPAADAARGVADFELSPDRVMLLDRELYLWCPNGILDSAFSKVNWDLRLGVAVTMRNWNTVLKLAELAAA